MYFYSRLSKALSPTPNGLARASDFGTLTLVDRYAILQGMTRYRGADLATHARGASKKTSVRHYTLFRDRIIVEFKGGREYTYTFETCGYMVDEMRDLARSGAGLNRYINENRPDYLPGGVLPGDDQSLAAGDYDGD